MLFAVRMDVSIPTDLDPYQKVEVLARERAYSQELQRAGEWAHIWRCVGQFSNLSVFDVADNARLHDILWNLPMFDYMTIEVIPLAPHPSDITVTE